MVYKPLDEKNYLRYLKIAGWSLIKGSIDYKLLDNNGNFVCAIKISHGKKTKKEVVANSIHKTEQEFKLRGLQWPPRKK
jgi:hypothetical protein